MKTGASFTQYLIATVIAVLALTLCAQAQTVAEVEKELKGLQNQWATARISGDVAFLEKLYAKEFGISSMDGNRVTRERDIAMFATKAMKPQVITDEDMEVSVYGDVALVTGREYVKGTYKDVPGEFWLRFTNVYVRREGRWQMVTHHSTEIRKK